MQAEIGDDGSGRTRIKRTTVGSRDSKDGMQAPTWANKGSVTSFRDEDDIDAVVAMMKSRMSMNRDTSSKLRGLPGYCPTHPSHSMPSVQFSVEFFSVGLCAGCRAQVGVPCWVFQLTPSAFD